MDILNDEPTRRPSTPDSRCSICLDDLTNKCYTNSCVHLSCFNCLLSWSNVCLQQSSNSEPTCPLCKETFRFIYHSFDEMGVFETYTVPVLLDRLPDPTPGLFVLDELSNGNRNQTTMSSVFGLNEVNYNNRLQLNHHPSQNYPRLTLNRQIDGQAMRIQVYVDNAWAEPLPDTAGNFRNCTPTYFRENPLEMYRLHKFILRDVVAIRESVRSEGQPRLFPENADMVTTILIMRSMAVHEIGQLHLLNDLRPFLNTHAVHFCHELNNFAKSAYEVSDYDRNVQYTYPRHDSELIVSFHQEQPPPIHVVGESIVQDSDDEELQRSNVIDVSSSTDDSDVEILSHPFSSTNLLNSASFDQPSTSSGILNSLDKPNNSLQAAHVDVPSVSYSSQVKRGSSNLDSSSDDEESIIVTQSSQNAHLKPLDGINKNKKNQQ